MAIKPPDRNRVKRFYDAFRDERLIRDLRTINIRQEAAIRLVRSAVPKNARVLEIGCGIGIIARALIQRASFILATDISEANVELARHVVGTKKVEFGLFDATNDDPAWIADRDPFDAVIMIDAIEHIKKDEHLKLLCRIESWLKPGGQLILTYPSPEYQTYLYRAHPEQVQIIDEVIFVEDITSKTEMIPRWYELKDVWRRGQYVHLILQKDPLNKLQPIKRSKLWHRIKRYRDLAWRVRNGRILKLIR